MPFLFLIFYLLLLKTEICLICIRFGQKKTPSHFETLEMSYLAFIDGEAGVAHRQHVLLKALHFEVIVKSLAKYREGLIGMSCW